MDKVNYWQRRLSRRRALTAGGIALGGVAFASIIGCGGSSSGDNQKIASRIEDPSDTSTQAKPGGLFRSVVNADESNLDPLTYNRSAGLGGPSRGAYSRLLRAVPKPGYPKSEDIGGDLAESYELTNDGLQLTVKLRPNAKWDPRAPTESRVVDADDVVFSWNRYASVSPYAGQLSNKSDPTVPVLSVQKTDNRTIVYKMAFPWSPLLLMFAHGSHFIEPREVDGGFDPRNTIRGSGPWMLSEYKIASNFAWRRNPNWFGETPYLEGYDEPIITEGATRQAQFLAKNVWTLAPNPDSIPVLLGGAPDIRVLAGELGEGHSGGLLMLGSRKGSPFYDIRVRRAVSMALDRDLIAQVNQATDRLEPAGFTREIFIDGPLPASYRPTGYWIDPKGNGLGEGAKYYRHNVAEAKKLMSAAGFESGIDMEAPYANGLQHIGEKNLSILPQMLAEIGLRLKMQAIDYGTVYLPKILVPGTVKGDFDGMSFASPTPFRSPTVSLLLYSVHHSKGIYTSARRWDDGQDKIDAIIDSMFKEFDENRLKDLVSSYQKEEANYQSGVTYMHATTPLTLTWPWVQNLGVFRSAQGTTSIPPFLKVWIDEEKRK